jgi:hypothetical protein
MKNTYNSNIGPSNSNKRKNDQSIIILKKVVQSDTNYWNSESENKKKQFRKLYENDQPMMTVDTFEDCLRVYSLKKFEFKTLQEFNPNEDHHMNNSSNESWIDEYRNFFNESKCDKSNIYVAEK